MKDTQTILEAYRNSDMTQRLYMFLEYRELRDEFVAIDRSDIKTAAARDRCPRPRANESLLCRWLAAKKRAWSAAVFAIFRTH